jgi:hypothetical protein
MPAGERLSLEVQHFAFVGDRRRALGVKRRTNMKMYAFLALAASSLALAAPAFADCPTCGLGTLNGASATALHATAAPKDRGPAMTVTGKTVRAVVLPSGARVALH